MTRPLQLWLVLSLSLSLSGCDELRRSSASSNLGGQDAACDMVQQAVLDANRKPDADGASLPDHAATDAARSCGEGAKPATFTWPVPAVHSVGQKFANPISYQTCGFHTGIDIIGKIGLDMVAIAAAKVIYVGYLWYNTPTQGRGPYAVVLQHSPEFYSVYSHNNVALVKPGDCVAMGQKVAEMGTLGYSSGPHLHFEIVEGTPFTGNWQVPFGDACKHYQDPLKYIKP
jgi:murein DD-endopeptidase MepM/ murein hydrolase activator NlpD